MHLPASVRALPVLFFSLLLSALSPVGSLQAHAQAQPQPNRILANPGLTPRTRLAGHIPGWVTPEADAGPAPAETTVRLTVLLARSPAMQAAFEQLLADQQNRASPRYHQWLTPTQLGEQFGPTPSDVAAVTQWLTHSGLALVDLSPSRTFLTVTGPAATVAAAFSVDFRMFAFNGEPRLSATTEPAIPTAFTGVVTAIDGLTDLPVHPMHRAAPAAPRASPESLQPLYSNATNTLHYVFPGDFTKIYDIDALIAAGYNGTGVKVAVISRSDIANSDITQLEGLAGLPSKLPNIILIPGSADPGVVPVDTGEATLDVGRVLTTAPGAQTDLVISASSSGGLSAGLQYNVNTLLDPIMTISYGLCEAAAGQSGVNFYNTLFSQAAAEGISTFVSSGDSGAAGCSNAFVTPTGSETLGMGNYLCASSFVTCVGGTEFNDANAAAYWGPGPTNTTPFVSALGYIPEGGWNEPTTTNSSGATVFQIAGSGSGPSAYIPKPSWQTGVGVPADGHRDIPDISFTASSHDGFFACLASSGSAFDCSRGGGVIYSGTSAATPSMAAVTAILSQRLNQAQGNLNPLLYQLAASSPTAFHDATPASSGVSPCTTATASICNNSIPGRNSLSGGLAGYPLQVGYDFVTGLGSLDVAHFVSAASANLNVTSVAVTANPAIISVNQTVIFTAAVTSVASPAPTGNVVFSSNQNPLGQPVGLTNGVGSSPPISFPGPGTYSITAAYSGDNASAGSTSSPIAFVVTVLPPTKTVAGATLTTLVAGQSTTMFSATVSPLSNSNSIPTGSIQFNANGKALGAPINLVNGGVISPPTSFPTAGPYAVTAAYSGDARYAASTSNIVNLLVDLVPTNTAVTSSPANPVVAGSTVLLRAAVLSSFPGNATGSIQFMVNGAPLGSPLALSNGAAQISTLNTRIAGTYAIVAIYSGDATFAPSTSSAVSVVVAPQTAPSGLALSSSAVSLILSSGSSVTSTITATVANSFTGSVALGCSVSPAVSAPPLCSLSSNTLTFASAQSASSTLTLSTVAPRDHPALLAGRRFDSGLALAALLLALLPRVRRRRLPQIPRLLAMLPLTLLLGTTLLTLSGCGATTKSGGGGTTPPAPTPAPPAASGTTPGTYQVTLTATSGGTITTMNVTLTVQ